MLDFHAVAVLLLAAGAFYLYSRPTVRMELVSLLLLLALSLLFHLFPLARDGASFTEAEVLAAFGHPALIAICCLMVVGRGLTMTGAMEPAVRLLSEAFGVSRALGSILTLLLAAAASAFINDTPVLVLMLPMLLSLADRTGYSASKTLMPVNFAILAGGMLTTIGTSTNLLVLSIASDFGMRPLGLFEFSACAGVALAIALLYLWLVAPRLLPENTGAKAEATRLYEATILVSEESVRVYEKTIAEIRKRLGRPLPVVAVARGSEIVSATDDLVLRSGDAVLLRDTPKGLQEIASALRLDLRDRLGEERFVEDGERGTDSHFAEIVLRADSELLNNTLAGTRFAARHGVEIVGLNRGAGNLLSGRGRIGETTLNAGDVLLVQGTDSRISALRDSPGLLLLDGRVHLPRSPLAPIALLIMAGVVVLVATKLLPVHVAAFVGMIAMLLTGCIQLTNLGRSLSLQVILLVASSVALGRSLVGTGAADWLARGFTLLVHGVPAAVQLGALMALAALLTNFVSNSAAAAVGTPIAIATATQLGSPVEPFVLAILFGANLSFATPMAYQTNLLVMAAGGYRFRDFVRVGTPLVLLMLVVLSFFLAYQYDL